MDSDDKLRLEEVERLCNFLMIDGKTMFLVYTPEKLSKAPWKAVFNI